MQVSTLVMEGMNLMLLGMGSVFFFLALLVVLLVLMSRLAKLLSKEEPTPAPLLANGEPASLMEDEEFIAVISAAISRYRSGQ